MFAGPPKPRGCEICRRGEDDQKLVAVAWARGYEAREIANFLIKTRNYPTEFKRDAIYRHLNRCKDGQWSPTRRLSPEQHTEQKS